MYYPKYATFGLILSLATLDTSNSNQWFFRTDALHFEILGGLSLDGLDRLRVTLKVSRADPAAGFPSFRHNLDLYNESLVEHFVRRVAEKLEVKTYPIVDALEELTTALETYRLQQMENTQVENQLLHEMTKKEKAKAMAYLKQPDLITRTGEDIGHTGVVGEEANRLLMYLIFTSRKMDHPLHVVCFGRSGLGKTYLQEKVAGLIPPEDQLEITSLSANAFYYFGQYELQHKLLLIEDLDGIKDALYPLRELQSKKRLTKTVVLKDNTGQPKTKHIKVEGPVCVAGCTTKKQIHEKNANRTFPLYLDESKAQDQRIMDYQRSLSAGQINIIQQQELKAFFQHCQRLLQPIRVVNPFASSLHLPDNIHKPRRMNAYYLALINTITFYHQFQRKVKRKDAFGKRTTPFIETTVQDIAVANQLILPILYRWADELSGPSRKYLELVREYLKQENKTSYTNREIRNQYLINYNNQKRFTRELIKLGFIEKAAGSHFKGYTYEAPGNSEFDLIKTKVDKAMDQMLKKVSSKSSGSAGH